MPGRSPKRSRKSPKRTRKSPKRSPRVKKASPTARPPKRGGCVEQLSNKYQNRPSPPYPANECRSQIKERNGKWYQSRLMGKIWRWVPI